jgi:iron(III) transport system permease protein
MPAILSAAVFTFVGAAGSFDVPLALGNPVGINTLSLAIFQRVADYPADYGQAAPLSAIHFLISGTWIVTQRRYVRSRDFTTVTGKGLRTVLIDLGRWRWVALGCNRAYVGVAVLLPLLVLVVISVQRYWAGRVDLSLLTWNNYDFVLVQYDISRRALINSIALAFGGATLGVLFALLLSQIIFRSRFATRAALDLLTTAPIAVPGIVLAMGILLGWLRTPIYGTLFILLIAYVAIYVPLAQRSIASVVLNISTDFEECARVTGASWLYTLRRIVVPLVRPGIVSGWLILLVLILTLQRLLGGREVLG